MPSRAWTTSGGCSPSPAEAARYQEPPPPPPPPPPEEPPPPLKPLEPDVDGGDEESVPAVVVVKPLIALENTMYSKGRLDRYHEDVSGGSPSRPENARAHLSTAPKTMAYGRYSENRFFFSANLARSFSDSSMKRRNPCTRRST